jgi:hypothetical protein
MARGVLGIFCTYTQVLDEPINFCSSLIKIRTPQKHFVIRIIIIILTSLPISDNINFFGTVNSIESQIL